MWYLCSASLRHRWRRCSISVSKVWLNRTNIHSRLGSSSQPTILWYSWSMIPPSGWHLLSKVSSHFSRCPHWLSASVFRPQQTSNLPLSPIHGYPNTQPMVSFSWKQLHIRCSCGPNDWDHHRSIDAPLPLGPKGPSLPPTCNGPSRFTAPSTAPRTPESGWRAPWRSSPGSPRRSPLWPLSICWALAPGRSCPGPAWWWSPKSRTRSGCSEQEAPSTRGPSRTPESLESLGRARSGLDPSWCPRTSWFPCTSRSWTPKPRSSKSGTSWLVGSAWASCGGSWSLTAKPLPVGCSPPSTRSLLSPCSSRFPASLLDLEASSNWISRSKRSSAVSSWWRRRRTIAEAISQPTPKGVGLITCGKQGASCSFSWANRSTQGLGHPCRGHVTVVVVTTCHANLLCIFQKVEKHPAGVTQSQIIYVYIHSMYV